MTKEENIKFRAKIINHQFLQGTEYKLNLENPRTFNEKLQWIKLYNHDPLMTKCADKYLVREYIKETIGEEYLIPLIGVWDRVEDIDFDKLPNQFVLKVNWGSGQNIIVNDKSKLNIEEAKNQLRYWLKPTSNHYYYSYEWQYKNINPKIICEEYIESLSHKDLITYGFYCFQGKTKLIHTTVRTHTVDENVVFYDTDWNLLDISFTHYKRIDENIQKPQFLEKMIELADKLSNQFIHARVDFYIIYNKLFVGEITFTTCNGTVGFTPNDIDFQLGEYLQLPKEKKLEYDVLDKEIIIKEACYLEPIVKEYRDLEHNFNCANINNSNIINTLNSDINIKNNTIDYLSNEIEDLKLNVNWFSILSIFGIQLFSISNNANYLRLTVLGIKLTFKVNEKSINKLAWWIPIRNLRDSFRNKFKIEDQTRPDQTRPDQT